MYCLIATDYMVTNINQKYTTSRYSTKWKPIQWIQFPLDSMTGSIEYNLVPLINIDTSFN